MNFNKIVNDVIGEARPGFPRLRPGQVIGGSGPIRRPAPEKRVSINIWFQVEGADEEDTEEAMLADNQEQEIHIIKVVTNKASGGRVKVGNWDWEEYWGTTYMGEFRGTPSDLRKVWKALMVTPELEITEPDTPEMFEDAIADEL